MYVYLVHESNTHTGGLFEIGGGWFSSLRFQRTKGVNYDYPVTVEKVAANFDQVCDYTDAEYPESGNDTILKMFDNYERNQELAGNKTGGSELQSDAIFTLINNFLLREGASAVQTCQAIYNFEITKTKKGKVLKTYGVDLKNGNGKVTKPYEKPDSTFRMTDANFHKVCMGKLNPQIAFLQVRIISLTLSREK